MVTSEINGLHGLPIDTTSLANELKQVLHFLGKISIGNVIKHKSAKRYAHRFIEQANKGEEKA